MMMKKLPKKYFNFTFSLIMSALMSGLMTLCITIYQFELGVETWARFLGAWKFSFPFAFVISQIVTPVAQKLTGKVVES
jgi:hypothetical protein